MNKQPEWEYKKPRLLFIVGRFVIGGHATDNIPLLFHLKDKYMVQIIYGEKEPDEMEPIYLLEQFPGLDLQKLPSLKRTINPFADLISLYKLIKKIKAFQPHIIHTHGSKSGFIGRIAGWFYGSAKIVHTYHGHLFHSYFNPFVSRLIIITEQVMSKITDAAIALGPTQKKELIDTYRIVSKSKVFEIPLGLFAPPDSSGFSKELSKRYLLKENDVAIGLIGRLVPIKNPMHFLKAAVTIISKGITNVKFFVVGDGQLKSEMINYLNEEKVLFSTPENVVAEAHIIFTSWISNVYEVIYELDIIALTSLNEGTPNSLIEAQLCSKPVVGYNVGGVKDTFINNVSGFLVEKNNIDSFIDKLLVLIDNQQLRIKMGKEGKLFSSQKYSKHKEVQLMDELYSHLLKDKN